MAGIWDFLSNRVDVTFNGTRAIDERRKREEEAERQRLIEAQRVADLEAQQRAYMDDAYADELYRRDRANTSAAIETGRQNMVSNGNQPARVETEQPVPYKFDVVRNVSDRPILEVDEEDPETDPTPSPLSYVLTGETYSDPADYQSGGKPNSEEETNPFWNFLGLADKEDRKRWSNGMLRAAGAILSGNDPDVWRNLGRGMTAYSEAGDEYDKFQTENALADQKRRSNDIALADAEKVKKSQAEIARIYQEAGPDGLTGAQKQRIASLYADMGEFKAAQEILGTNTKPVNYQKGDTYYAPDGSLYTQTFDPATGRTLMLDAAGNEVTNPDIIKTLRQDDKKRAGQGQGQDLFLTKGEEKRDEEFGKSYEDIFNNINRATVSMAKIDDAIGILESNPDATGNIISNRLPEWMQAYLNPDGTIGKERIYEVVQSSLKEALGAQFTQIEGDNLMKRAWNPDLPAEENLKRVKALLAEVRNRVQNNTAKINYFDTNGTLKGFKGTYLSADEIADRVFGSQQKNNSNRSLGNGGPVLNPNSSNLPDFLRPRG